MSDETQQKAEPGAGGLSAYRARERDAEDHDIFDEAATYEDASRAGTVAAAADQPYLVKARQRQEYADSDPSQHHDTKARSPLKLSGATWKYSFKRTLAEFSRDQCTDLAAGLTYYAVLSVFPALIALVSLLSLVGEAERTTQFFVDMVDDLTEGNDDVMSTVELVVGNITATEGAGLGLAVGILLAMWTASNYVNAFSRATNRIYEVEEGRPFIRLRPLLYMVTVGLIVLVGLAAVALVVSGAVAESIGVAMGLDQNGLEVWDAAWTWASPFALILVAAAGVALLYYCTPNIRQPGATWISGGALIAIVVMILATGGVAFYVMNFANYDATYGSLASVIIFLFWIYVMNVVLLFGMEFDAELERGRELQAGIEAERTIMLAPRQIKGAEKKNKKYEAMVGQAQALRLTKGETSDPADVWRR